LELSAGAADIQRPNIDHIRALAGGAGKPEAIKREHRTSAHADTRGQYQHQATTYETIRSKHCIAPCHCTRMLLGLYIRHNLIERL
jgi:hypothetical protein